MKNKPNLPKCQNNHNLSLNKGIRKSPTFQPPKQTQFTERQNKRNLRPDNGLRKQTPLYEKRNTNYAKQTQFAGCSNERNLSLGKGLRKSPTLQPSPKQTQSNPIPNLFPASLPPSIRFLPTPLCRSGEGNSWHFMAIMVKIPVTKGLYYYGFERFWLINFYIENNFEKAGDMKVQKACRGFTLIELLVVISIISMLMAISLPSLGNAREQGERVHCMANMNANLPKNSKMASVFVPAAKAVSRC